MEDEGFWCPTLIEHWRNFLSRGVPNDGALRHRRAFISNLGYSLQYLQFLDYQIREVNLHATVYTHTLKSFVVAGMGIIEAVSWYLLKRKDWNRKHDWEQVAELQSQTYRDGDDELRVVNRIEKKLSEPAEIEMSLQWMIRRVEKKKLLGMDGQVYRDLNYLRGLRNKVHLHVVQHDSDTDWNAFSNNELKLMKKALFGVFSSEIFDPTERHRKWLEFLRVEESTEELVEDIPF